MWFLKPLSKRGTVETWCFAGIIVFSAFFLCVLHRKISTREYYTTHQQAQLKSIVSEVSYNISKNRDVPQQLKTLGYMQRLVSDESSEKILGFRLSTLYATSQALAHGPK